MITTQNAIIQHASISTSDVSVLTVWMTLDYGNSAQGFGGYALQLPKHYKHYELKGFAGHFIFRCMEIAGVTDWKDVVGKSVRVKSDSNKVHAIGHITQDDWFCPADDFASPQGQK